MALMSAFFFSRYVHSDTDLLVYSRLGEAWLFQHLSWASNAAVGGRRL